MKPGPLQGKQCQGICYYNENNSKIFFIIKLKILHRFYGLTIYLFLFALLDKNEVIG